MKYKLKIKQS